MEVSAIILAAGKGTRMNSMLPKCAHTIIDKSMVEYVIDNLTLAGVGRVVTIVGYGKEELEKILKDKSKFAVQDKQLGTAHAVMMAEDNLKDFKGITIIALGDMPMISSETYKKLIEKHLLSASDLTVLTTDNPNPFGYGRIKRDVNGDIVGIVEEKDASSEEKKISEINSSVYVVDNSKLFPSLKEIDNNNIQKEYYLGDIIAVFNKKSYKVSSYKALNYLELSGVNDKHQLMMMEEEFQSKIIKNHLINGVSIHRPTTVTIGENVTIEAGAIIKSGSVITGKSIIRSKVVIGPNSFVDNSVIESNSVVINSQVVNSIIEENEVIGPFEYVTHENLF